jgi:hypothetical protein
MKLRPPCLRISPAEMPSWRDACFNVRASSLVSRIKNVSLLRSSGGFGGLPILFIALIEKSCPQNSKLGSSGCNPKRVGRIMPSS